MNEMAPLGSNAVHGTIAMIVITVWIGGAVVGCSSDDNAVDTETPDVGADTSIDASFAEDVDASDDVHDVSFDTDDGSSYEPSWSECDCPNPEEKCTIRHFCGLPDAERDPGSGIGCPEGYTCQRDHAFGDFVCICKGDHEMCTPVRIFFEGVLHTQVTSPAFETGQFWDALRVVWDPEEVEVIDEIHHGFPE